MEARNTDGSSQYSRNIYERRKREAYYVCFIFLDFLSIIPFCILDM